MNLSQDHLKGRWHQLKGQVRQRWAQLTNDDLAAIEGGRETLVGSLQTRYGMAKEQAAAEVAEFERQLSRQ